MCDLDENGLETIDLTEDTGVTNSGTGSVAPKPVAATMMSMATMLWFAIPLAKKDAQQIVLVIGSMYNPMMRNMTLISK